MTATVPAGPPDVHEAFCELLLADPERVREEFEALVAASWRVSAGASAPALT
ncbi:hypothetical protein GTR00_14590, partial [Kineococcus sp. T90]|nr:hypothetical protein [Kineococcus indalonis]